MMPVLNFALRRLGVLGLALLGLGSVSLGSMSLGSVGFGLVSPVAAQPGTPPPQDADLASLVDVLVGGPAADRGQPPPCLQALEKGPAHLAALDCLIGHIGASFELPDQWQLFHTLFYSRYSDRQTWQEMQSLLVRHANDAGFALATAKGEASGDFAAFVDFADLAGSQSCPPAFSELGLFSLEPLQPGDEPRRWLAAPDGTRDLSPPQVRRDPLPALLRQGLQHPNPAGVLAASPCTALQLPLARALFHSALGRQDMGRAEALAALAFMPARYQRQILGAQGDQAGQAHALTAAADRVLAQQQVLGDPAAAAQAVGFILGEIDHQFAIDFLLGQIWVSEPEALLALAQDPDFLSQVVDLLSRDAALLQQGYQGSEVRLFYPDFFAALVAKQGFALLRSLDMLVPAPLENSFANARNAAPLTGATPSRFERVEEALALLIRGQDSQMILGLWEDLSPQRRRDSLLYALDQGAFALGQSLYPALRPGDVNADFLIRYALYYAGYYAGSIDSLIDSPIDAARQGEAAIEIAIEVGPS